VPPDVRKKGLPFRDTLNLLEGYARTLNAVEVDDMGGAQYGMTVILGKAPSFSEMLSLSAHQAASR
jgi:hypothetical protein